MRQVGRAAERDVDGGVDRLQRHLGRLARGHVGRLGDEVGACRRPSCRQSPPGDRPRPRPRTGRAPDRPASFASQASALVARPLARLAPRAENIGRDLERRGRSSRRFFARASNFGGAERRAVGGLRALLVGRAEADGGAAGDQGRPVAGPALHCERRLDRLRIMAVDRERASSPRPRSGSTLVGRGRRAPSSRRW